MKEFENVRASAWNSNKTEPHLLKEHEGIKEAWDEVMAVKRQIAEEQAAAILAIEEKYKEQFENALTDYAMLLKLYR
jgi:hypothetical protein